MSEGALTPFPPAVLLDTSFLRTLGGTRTSNYRTFIDYVEQHDVRLFLPPRVIAELDEQQAYMSIDWVDKAETTDWIERTGTFQPGVRVHDGPRAGAIFDRVHAKIAKREQIDPDELRKRTRRCLQSQSCCWAQECSIGSGFSSTTITQRNRSHPCCRTRITTVGSRF
jgi:hypothetical protein